jgi:hypothetical protein
MCNNAQIATDVNWQATQRVAHNDVQIALENVARANI